MPILEGLDLRSGAGDKVGVVGRNGAGKTSLLKVIAGEAPPLAGRVRVRGRSATCARTPVSTGRGASTTALTHVLQARGLQEMAERLEKYRLALEERPSDDPSGGSRVSRSGTGRRRVLGRGRGARIAAGLGLPQDRLELPVPALSGGERRRLELARILFGGSGPAAARRADQPPRHRREALADAVPRAYRARCWS